MRFWAGPSFVCVCVRILLESFYVPLWLFEHLPVWTNGQRFSVLVDVRDIKGNLALASCPNSEVGIALEDGSLTCFQGPSR